MTTFFNDFVRKLKLKNKATSKIKIQQVLSSLSLNDDGIYLRDGPFECDLLGFTPYWDYKPTNAFHADSSGVYTNDKILKLNTKNKIHLKCDSIDGSVINGIRQPILCSFVLDKPSRYKVFCEPEIFQNKKINESVLNTITFYLEDDNNNEEVDFNGKTLTLLYK